MMWKEGSRRIGTPGEKRICMPGGAGGALADFRTALSYSHDNAHYQLRLAQALVAAGNRGTRARKRASTC